MTHQRKKSYEISSAGYSFVSRVATKISRNQIPRYFVLFLFIIIILFIFAKMFLFGNISTEFCLFGSNYLKENLSQYGGMKVWRLPPPLPELTEVMLVGIGQSTQSRVLCIMQSWALAHFSEVRYPLPTQFFPLDR
jgi:hypothetical protein